MSGFNSTNSAKRVQEPGKKPLKTTPAPPVASFSQIRQKVSGISVSGRLSRTRADARWVPARAPAGRRPGSINNAPLADQIARGFRRACLDLLSSVRTERDAISLSFPRRLRPRRSLHSPAPRIRALLLHGLRERRLSNRHARERAPGQEANEDDTNERVPSARMKHLKVTFQHGYMHYAGHVERDKTRQTARALILMKQKLNGIFSHHTEYQSFWQEIKAFPAFGPASKTCSSKTFGALKTRSQFCVKC